MKFLPRFFHFRKASSCAQEQNATNPAHAAMPLHSRSVRLEEVDKVAKNIFGRVNHPESPLVTKKLIGMVSALSEDEKLLLKEQVRRMKGGIFFPWLEEFSIFNPESKIVHNKQKSCWEISNLDISKPNARKTYEITAIAAEKMSRIEKIHRAFWGSEEFGTNRHNILVQIQVVSKLLAGK